MDKKIDISIERWMYWSDEVNGLHLCPKCKTPLKTERHAYLLMLKNDEEISPFIVGNEGGHFCPNCPVVVLEKEIFTKFAGIADSSNDSEAYTITGIIDFDKIPKEKREIPLGEDDNPIPLVEFLNHKSKKESIRNDKIGRNAPCPCGSGKKYKKCCLSKKLIA